MDKKTVSPGLVFLLVLLVVAGIFLLYSRLTFTGYVTNIGNATTGEILSSRLFDEGDFSNTVVNSQGSVVLMPTKTTGTFTSQSFDAGQNVFWTEFAPAYVIRSSSNYTEDPLNNSIIFYVRSCDDNVCTGKDFVPYSGNLNLVGQYFQYKLIMQILSGNESPKLSEVNVSHYPPNTPYINIESPQNIIYNNESVPIKISSNPGVTIWFYNGTGNELYTAGINRTFTEGAHVLNVSAIYVDGRITYTNYASVSFTVGFLKVFYRYSGNACSAVTLTQAQKTANDYTTNAECQTHITTTTTTTETTTTQSCAASWDCEWGECVDGVQTETCTDTSTCTTVATPPPVRTQACTGGIVTTPEPTVTTTVVPETTTTTTPAKKGFFSFVGSAIVGPVFKSTVGVVLVILLVLVAGGFLAYKFLLNDKLKLKLKSKFFNFKNKKKLSFFN